MSPSATVDSVGSETTLTPAQISNWRKVLFETLGPYALMMPDSEVQKTRDAIQAHIDAMPTESVSLYR